ncbi:hypothetical protein AK812_SmicGene44951 [Symbiodinium microadriaticum]|uniref:Uncharacterized protein n=1 Tax=Symbiodinium microadriaticum TaxID=2951 RepID=A0A1Q9BXA6_SYMMI|nr:hypothetical protein AK812_SmicGene44951 [Symbiodinium microadriaticum]
MECVKKIANIVHIASCVTTCILPLALLGSDCVEISTKVIENEAIGVENCEELNENENKILIRAASAIARRIWIELFGLNTGTLHDIAVFYSPRNWIAVTNRRIFILDDGQIAARLFGCTDVKRLLKTLGSRRIDIDAQIGKVQTE